MIPTPDLSYLMAVHIPLLQGEMPAVAVVRKSPDDVRLIRINEVRGRKFHDNAMSYLAEMADKLAKIDGKPETHAHLIFSGNSLGGAELQELLKARWVDESYSYVRLAHGGEQPMLDINDERLPFNQFKIPRMSIINAIMLAYNEPGKIYFSLADDEAGKLEEQLSLFSERTATLPANDPDAILEHKGEGRVIATGVALWHHFNAQAVRARWARESLEG